MKVLKEEVVSSVLEHTTQYGKEKNEKQFEGILNDY